MDDFLRYSCQVALPGFGETAQQLLQHAKVLVVGAGGLGCPAAQYLAASGIGVLGIADFDTVSISNLHRQVLYSPLDAGKKKAVIACERLQQQNPGIKLIPHDLKIKSANVMLVISQYDIIVDCTDNFDTRYLLNDAAVMSGKPIVYGAIYQFEGQVAVWNCKNSDGTYSPNYRDLFPNVDPTQVPNCAEGGVLPTIAGIIGCMQANEVIKYITQTGELLAGKISIMDALTLQSRIIKLAKTTGVIINQLKDSEIPLVITVKDLRKCIAEDTVELIDVRTQQERDVFNIGGKHIPIDEIESSGALIDYNKSIVCYCASGIRSAQAVKVVSQQYPQAKVFSLEGGLKAWKETPVV